MMLASRNAANRPDPRHVMNLPAPLQGSVHHLPCLHEAAGGFAIFFCKSPSSFDMIEALNRYGRFLDGISTEGDS